MVEFIPTDPVSGNGSVSGAYDCGGAACEVAARPIDFSALAAGYVPARRAAAIAAVDGLVPDETIRQFARDFGGVEHRIELVRTYRGVRYYNDSIASSPSPACSVTPAIAAGACPCALAAASNARDKG